MKEKLINFKINVNKKDFEIEKFIKSFELEGVKIDDIWIKDHFYIISIPDNENLVSDFKSLFEDYIKLKEKEILKEMSAEERYSSMPYGYISDNVDLKEKKELIIEELKTRKYEESFLKERKELLSISEDYLVKSLSKILSELYEVETEKSIIFISKIKEEVNSFFEKYPMIGQKIFSSYELFEIDFKEIAKNPDQNYIKLAMKNDKIVREFCDILSKQQVMFRNKRFPSMNSSVLTKALEASGLKDLSIKFLKNNNVSYEEYKIIDEKIFEIINKFELPKTYSLYGKNPFSFFNTYNMLEKDYSEKKPFVNEVIDIFLAKKISEYQVEIFKKADEIIESFGKEKKVSLSNINHEIELKENKVEFNKPKL